MDRMMKLHRRAIESTYTGTFKVVECKGITDDVTKITKMEEVAIIKDQPCKLSYSSISTTSPDGNAAQKIQTIKLFLAPEVVIGAGSKVVVTQDGVTRAYASSGVSAVYPSHQEINLELDKGRA